MSYYGKGPKGRADALFSRIVRARGRCEMADWAPPGEDPTPCKGPLQCCHFMSRTYSNTRCDEGNAWSMCAGHHARQGNDPILTVAFAVHTWGPEHVDEVRQRALHVGQRVDWGAVLEQLRSRAEALGV